MIENEIILEILNVKKYFPIRHDTPRLKKKWLMAVDGVSINVQKGETIALVGESGCGKSTLAWTVSGIYQPTSGTVKMHGKDLHSSQEGKLLANREIQMVFQDPFSSLNPRMSLRNIIAEPLTTHYKYTGNDLDKKIIQLLDMVAMGEEQLRRFPHQISGGQRQRISIARALALNPEIVILDEPTSSLDVSVQAQIINLLIDLQNRLQLTYIYVTHQLSVAKYISSRIVVMYLGQFVEIADTKVLFEKQLHPYTSGLLRSEPLPDPDTPFDYSILEGDIPSPTRLPQGCRFHTRCPIADDLCSKQVPDIRQVFPGHWVRCLKVDNGDH